MFSKSCEYGIRAMLYIAYKSQSNERVGVKDIAKAINSPEAFTGKIMQQLSKSGLVESVKGPSGGFWISEKDREKVNLCKIVEVLDGSNIYEGCVLGLNKCSDKNPCPIHSQYKPVREVLKKMHTEISLDEMASQLSDIATLK
jgi:Rrf2 family protein